jgi:hypothetical protein
MEDPTNPGRFADADITNININGNDGNPYHDAKGYPWKSLEKDIIDHISHDARTATTHTDALAAMQADGDVGSVGGWFFRDANHNGLPDVDTPYFYHEGDVLNPLPFKIGMFRLRNIYFYVNGNIRSFQMAGTGAGLNLGQIYLIASNDVWTFDMMNMSMMNAGMVVIAGNDVTNSSMMKGGALKAVTVFANHDIKLTSGFGMTLGQRLHLLAANDVISTSGFDMSMFTFGSSNSHCGCTGAFDETTDFAIGRRFNG